MSAYEKEIAKREALNIVISYPYKVVPVSDKAKYYFAHYNKKNGPVESRSELIKKYLNVEKAPFTGNIGFYYDDSTETDEQKKAEVRNIATRGMAEKWVPGITHPKSGRSTGFTSLLEGEDYTIEVGEKIIHEQPKSLTFEDIKAL